MASKTLYIIIGVLVVILAAVGILLTTGGQQQPTQTPPPTPTATTPTQTPTTPTATTAQKVFKLGALLPLTGGFSSYAKLAQCASQLAIDELNAEYASKGYRFELYVEDTQLDPNVALQKLQALYARGVRAVHAGLTSREASGEKPFADQNKIILFSAWSTSSLLAIPNDWLYRIVGTDAKQIRAIGAILKELGVKNVALIYRKDPYGEGLYLELQKEAAKRGFKLVSVAAYDPDPKAFPQAAPEAVRKISTEVKDLVGPDFALVIVSFEDDGSVVLKAIGQDPVLSKARLIGTEGMAFSPILLQEGGDVMARGRIVGTANWALPTTPEYKQFYQKFKEKCGAEPITPAPQSYDIIKMLGEIIATIGTDDPDKVRATLEQWGKQGTYKGATGVVLLDENGDRANPNFLLWGVAMKDGKPTYIEVGYYNYDKDTIEFTPEGKQYFYG
ncbi:ABC transporter substrate-binding protein [Pyrobaculum ferrireducens]|uniref:Branched-chain amino acid binding protein, putative n=1 Tax=Pyrobaculum ferrireducens TaxID=1104324 RepID=G7VDH7_9CREN|nr:ABC transporter substrate-binding protein [Pyrobaculum ferrireducens]AET32762.1 branched-chain amino acid binding protein, putative [Pyrobaculum ferrireducens]